MFYVKVFKVFFKFFTHFSNDELLKLLPTHLLDIIHFFFLFFVFIDFYKKNYCGGPRFGIGTAFFIIFPETPWCWIKCTPLEYAFLKTFLQIWQRTFWFCWCLTSKCRLAEFMDESTLLHWTHNTFSSSIGINAACSWSSTICSST